MLRSALIAVVLLAPSLAHAHEFFAVRVPNRAMTLGDGNVLRPCITCHNNPNGGAGCLDMGGTSPCLNPFGMQFRANGFFWNDVLAGMDADGDGFTNGQELQDPNGSWTLGEPSPGNADYVTRPGFPEFSPGGTDADGDGYCWFGQDLNSSGDCLDEGENNGARDCNDEDGAINSGAEELCSNAIDNDCNGLTTIEDPACESVVDRDGDGVCPMGLDINGDGDCIDGMQEMTLSVDCDDNAITVYPGNRENCFDGIDNDCDGFADENDMSCRPDADADGDGYCPVGRDLNGDGDCVDEGEPMEGGFDCDDVDPAINSGQTEICEDAFDNDCDGDANYADSECRGFFDEDGDGYCPTGQDLNGDSDCIDDGEADGESDCDDTNATVNPGAAEEDIGCTDDIDQDCDGLISLSDPDCATHLDTDGDQYCEAGFDRNGDGDCADENEGEGGSDCRDDLADVNPTVSEAGAMCTDGIDNDCDGSLDHNDPGIPTGMGMFDDGCREYRDSDRDGWCVIGRDTDNDGNCSSDDEVMAANGLSDAAPDDPTIYPMAPENCFDGLDNDQDGNADELDDQCTGAMDADGDRWCPVGFDLNRDGDCMDEGEQNFATGDCNDIPADGDDPGGTMIHPGVRETVNDAIPEEERGTREDELRALCQNFIDDDCDTFVDLDDFGGTFVMPPEPGEEPGPDPGPNRGCVVFLDVDGDGFCPEGIDDTSDGDCLDIGESRFSSDCDDRRGVGAAINTGALEICDDRIDNDCDDDIDMFDTQCMCAAEMCPDDGDPCTMETCDDNNRCIRLPAPECQDAGMPDAGTPDAGLPDTGSDASADAGEMMPDDDDGCNCSAPGVVGGRVDAKWLWAMGLALVLRRRKRR